ncbi:Transposon IS605 OrfB [Oscillochloris trichoides DG-6]|uniref:Transposon IS605 OrfB n=1 Tax=Oscillochloris trichoides DG-6 TaxID=765420 RepID=E1IAM1_9CHLR|nr:helix-turn-helix domain-containing protein [Oscillochloris trichoides]EFO81795.1 Transposon IS605 OrfB [Oscillochloris trichoides DG-6]
MIRAHTIRLNPTPEQANLFRQAAGTARFCYNWGLRAIKDALDQGMPVPTHRALRDAFKRIRTVEYPWTFQVGKSAIDGAFVNLGRAVKNFLDSRSGRRKGKKVGFPAFKSRKRGYGSFYVANDRFSVDGHTLKAQKIGTVNMTEPLRFVGKILGATIRYQAGWWWISIQVEVEHTPPTHTGPTIGVDLGITSLAVTSAGEVFENPKTPQACARHGQTAATVGEPQGEGQCEPPESRRQSWQRRISGSPASVKTGCTSSPPRWCGRHHWWALKTSMSPGC